MIQTLVSIPLRRSAAPLHDTAPRYPKKIVPPTLKSLRRRAADNSLEVEHILEAAAQRIEGLPDLLAELSATENWSETTHLPDGTHVVPLARWARVGSAYCSDGISGLRVILREPDHESFVLALLEELHSVEAVNAVMEFFSDIIKSPNKDPRLADKVASTLNQILCFKPWVEMDSVTQEQIRHFATELIPISSDQVERATPVLLLRAVGDEASMELLDNLPPFTDAWETTIPTTKRAIRRRLKTKRG